MNNHIGNVRVYNRKQKVIVKKYCDNIDGYRLIDGEKEIGMENTNCIPYWNQYTLTIEEASEYFRIGETKLRRLVHENPNAKYLLHNGNRIQIKRVLFERFIDSLDAI